MSGAARLADAAIQAFLAAQEVVTLATVQPDGSPLAMPMWHLPDGDTLVMISVDGLAKVRNLRRDPRVCVVAEAGTRGDVRGVAIQGRVEFLADGPERRISSSASWRATSPTSPGSGAGARCPPTG